jgi:repressor LexA
MVIVDKSLNPVNGDIVIAQIDGEWTMKIFKKKGNSILLIPDNPKYKPIKPKSELKVAGVVTSVIRKYK